MAETAQVARAGYREVRRGRTRSSTCSPPSPRRSSWCARSPTGCATRRRVGPFRNLRVGRRHIHHFVPGIVIAFASGAAAILTRDERARAQARGAVRRGNGAHARRVGAAARAGRRLLAPGGAAERADHARRDRDARRAGAGAAASCGAASRSCWSPAVREPRSCFDSPMETPQSPEQPRPDRPRPPPPGGPQAPTTVPGRRRRRARPPAAPPPAASRPRGSAATRARPPGGWQQPIAQQQPGWEGSRSPAGAAASAPRCIDWLILLVPVVVLVASSSSAIAAGSDTRRDRTRGSSAVLAYLRRAVSTRRC